jgi:hypothetical protein
MLKAAAILINLNKDNDSEETGENKSRSFKKPENGEMPDGFSPEKFSGEKTEELSKPEDGEKTRSFSKFDRNKKNSKYTLTGEQEALRIPVGTTVTTSLGVKTDFDVLSAVDIIKCSDGKDVITEV